MNKRLKITIISFVALSVVAIMMALINHFSHAGKVLVDIKIAPYEAVVFIDDQDGYTNNSSAYLDKGEHKVTAFLEGFALYSETVEITDDTESITGALIPISELGEQETLENEMDFADLDNYAAKELAKSWAEKKETYPILNYIPYTKNAYGIGYKEQDDNFILNITADNVAIDTAVNKLRSFDDSISLAEYRFEINNFSNILAKEFKDNFNSDPIEYLKVGYNGIGEKYTINNGESIGDYYYTTISVGAYAGYVPVTYRILLQKSGDSWQIVSSPYPLLTIYNTPNVDIDVLNAVNKLDAPQLTLVQDDASN